VCYTSDSEKYGESFPLHIIALYTVICKTVEELHICLCRGGARAGVPGVPGAADLEAALRRLTPAEVLARRATLSSGLAYAGYDYPDGSHTPHGYLPYGCRTPDSIMSTGSSGLSGFSGHSTGSWKLPEKLQVNYLFLCTNIKKLHAHLISH